VVLKYKKFLINKAKGNYMPRISSEKAIKAIGNCYDLILIAAVRQRELKRGYKPKVETTNLTAITALQEIEQGLIGREYLKKVK
jgi:DNA-directed RNA polymerase subunit omega